jgi:hypothetical protein
MMFIFDNLCQNICANDVYQKFLCLQWLDLLFILYKMFVICQGKRANLPNFVVLFMKADHSNKSLLISIVLPETYRL